QSYTLSLHDALPIYGRTVLMLREDEPWTWVREQGKGRVFYTAYGHDERTWSQLEFHDLLIRGILWALGDEKRTANRAQVASLPKDRKSTRLNSSHVK